MNNSYADLSGLTVRYWGQARMQKATESEGIDGDSAFVGVGEEMRGFPFMGGAEESPRCDVEI